jgi:flagellar biosynthesis protein
MRSVKKQSAAAVKYAPWQGPATVIAKGDGQVAEEIVAVAREHGVPIHSDPVLAGVLCRMELDDQIPGEVFFAVSAVLGFVYRLQAEQEGSGVDPLSLPEGVSAHTDQEHASPLTPHLR